MAGSKISRIAITHQAVEDTRIEPVKMPERALRAFPDLQEFEAAINGRLADIHRSYNGMAEIIRHLKLRSEATTETATTTVAPIAPGTKGDDGEDGEDGEDGTPGSVWHHGSGVPSNAIGINGDYYLDLDTGDVYFKEGGTWL